MPRTTKQETISSRVSEIRKFYKNSGRMPSYSEISDLTGLRSKNAVFKFIAKLEKMKIVEKDDKGRLIPLGIARTVRVLGPVEAGFPSPSEVELVDTLSLDELLIQDREAAFLLKVSDDSLSGAGILPGDMVIADKSQTPKSGDIVIAQVDGVWTMKYLRKRGNTVTLIPANPRYQPTKPKNGLKVAGVVTAVVRKYQ